MLHLSVELTFIKSKENISFTNSKAKVVITTPEIITKTVLNGSGDIVFKDPLSSIRYVEINGSGNITSNIVSNYADLSFIVSGSGNIIFNGKTINEKAILSGSGNIDLAGVIAQNAEAVISGSGKVTVNATNELNATITGSGNIYYYGNPILTSNITGSGNLIKK